MSPPRSMHPHALRLSRFHSCSLPKNAPLLSLGFPPGSPGFGYPDRQTRLLPYDGRTLNSLALLGKSSSRGLRRCGDARSLRLVQTQRAPFSLKLSRSPALLLPTLVSLAPLQLQLNATVLKQAAFYRTENRAERTPLLPSSVHIPASPQLCVCLCVRARSNHGFQFPLTLSKHS